MSHHKKALTVLREFVTANPHAAEALMPIAAWTEADEILMSGSPDDFEKSQSTEQGHRLMADAHVAFRAATEPFVGKVSPEDVEKAVSSILAH